ncbi:serine hydrolase domain-containing protein [Candidatus Albibeggiatoa sp. nov. BB20]|uniref:serine hydrolase domain-containing protein n=1 Tax=Candidatus Albibeggiatoa sp. nov. BB20 TaxID=3162723 RepID=UPI0033656EF4
MTAQAEQCATSSLVDGLDINIPCLSLNATKYSTRLLNYPQGELSWQWDENLTPVTCADEITDHCVQLDDSLNLDFPSLDISGQDYSAKLNYSSDISQYAWHYHSHTEKNTNPQQSTAINSVLSADDVASLRQYMNTLITEKQIPGAVLAVAIGTDTVLLDAYGQTNISQGTKTTNDSLFHIGSTNKAITSALIAILVDEGILNWDRKIQDIYPQFTLSNPAYANQITIRQLLDMTSGLPVDADEVFDVPARAVLDGLGNVKLIGSPGGQYEYSNLSVSLAAYLAVLAKAKADNGSIQQRDLDNVHADYEKLLREKLLQPLGMSNSYLYVDEARATGKMSKSYHLSNGQFVLSESVDEHDDNLAPSGGLKSTAQDMLRYMIMELQQGVSADGQRIVSTANMQERQKLSIGAAKDNDYGLCLEIKNINQFKFIGHSGSYDDFNSTIGLFPDQQLAFVLLVNGDSPSISDLTDGGIEAKITSLLAD